MNPLIGGALVQGVGGLLGGLFGRRSEKKAIAAQNAYNDPSAIRRRFEAAGFNPLLGIQPGVGMQAAVGGTNYIGSAIADGVAGLASAWSESAVKKQELQKLQQENEKLQKKVTVQTIRPTTGGLYNRPSGEKISISATPARGMLAPDGRYYSEYEAEWVGNQVMQPNPDGTYQQRNPARTAITTPIGEITPDNISDAEDWEKRYGDPVSWAVGFGNLAADAGRSLRRWTDKSGYTPPTENLATETLPRVVRKGVKAWADWSKAERKLKGGEGNRGYGTKSGAYEGWMGDAFGKGHLFK